MPVSLRFSQPAALCARPAALRRPACRPAHPACCPVPPSLPPPVCRHEYKRLLQEGKDGDEARTEALAAAVAREASQAAAQVGRTVDMGLRPFYVVPPY